jgi:hypothetical protein
MCYILCVCVYMCVFVYFQLDAQNSYLFTYNTFIKILYMFRALPCSSSGGLRRNCIYMCVCLSLVNLHTKCMGLIKLSSVACLTVPYFSTLSYIPHNLRRKMFIGRKMFVLIHCTTPAWNISHYNRIDSDLIKNLYWSSSKVPFMHVRF